MIIAHLGAPEYADFLDLAGRCRGVFLDTTMACTDFMNRIAPFPPGLVPRLGAMGDRIVLGTEFPNIPHPYLTQPAPSPASISAMTGCARSAMRTRRACSACEPSARGASARQPAQANAAATGASRSTSSGPLRSGSAMKTVRTPRWASSRYRPM
jgi:hypothetical protein